MVKQKLLKQNFNQRNIQGKAVIGIASKENAHMKAVGKNIILSMKLK